MPGRRTQSWNRQRPLQASALTTCTSRAGHKRRRAHTARAWRATCTTSACMHVRAPLTPQPPVQLGQPVELWKGPAAVEQHLGDDVWVARVVRLRHTHTAHTCQPAASMADAPLRGGMGRLLCTVLLTGTAGEDVQYTSTYVWVGGGAHTAARMHHATRGALGRAGLTSAPRNPIRIVSQPFSLCSSAAVCANCGSRICSSRGKSSMCGFWVHTHLHVIYMASVFWFQTEADAQGGVARVPPGCDPAERPRNTRGQILCTSRALSLPLAPGVHTNGDHGGQASAPVTHAAACSAYPVKVPDEGRPWCGTRRYATLPGQ